MRGILISKTVAFKKARTQIYEKEKKKVGALESQHKITLNPDLLPAIQEVRNNDKLLTSETEKKSKFLRQSYNEMGPKATRLLARKLVKLKG